MSGSGASNLGYGNNEPNSNVSNEFVNKTGSTYAGNFGSNVIPSSAHSMPEPPSNVVAASGTWTGNGGRKNVGRVYKMKSGKSKSRKMHTRRRRSKSIGIRRMGRNVSKSVSKVTKGTIGLATRLVKGSLGLVRKAAQGTRKMVTGRRRKSRRHKKSTKRRRMRGGAGMGYDQFQSNVPFTPGYSVADANLAPNQSSLANPPPIEPYNHCQDNYNHYAATQGK